MGKSKLDYFFTAYFLFISAKTTFLYTYNIFWFLFSLSCLSYGLYKNQIYKRDLIIIFIFIANYLIFTFFRNTILNKLELSYFISDLFFLFKYIIISFLYIAVFKTRATGLISEVIIKLASISLVLYLFQLIGGEDILYMIGTTFQNAILPYQGSSETYSNFLIFTYDKLHHIRNSGFAWEPGAFGCFLAIGLLFHFMNNNFIFDKYAKIFSIAIITTLSTTAFLSYGIILLLYYRINGGKIGVKIAIPVIIAIIAFINIPFLGEKIIQTYEEDTQILKNPEEITNQLDYYSENGGEVKLNRFSSAIFLYQEFGTKLILGVSNDYVNLKSNKYGVKISKFNISNGTIDFIAKFGLLGFFFLLFKIGEYIYVHYQKLEYSFYAIFLILTMNFGEPLLILPITLIFLFLKSFSVIEEELVTET